MPFNCIQKLKNRFDKSVDRRKTYEINTKNRKE